MKNSIFREKYGSLIQELIDDIRKTSVYYIEPDCVVVIEELSEKVKFMPRMKI